MKVFIGLLLACLDAAGMNFTPQPDAASRNLHLALEKSLPKLNLAVSPAVIGQPPASGPIGSGEVPLTLTDVANMTLKLTATGAAKEDIWQQAIQAPAKTTYTLPIAKAALFGKSPFTLGLAESGAVTTIGYGTGSGASGAMNAGATLATALTGSSKAEQAAEIQAQADSIAQQQRLVRCQASPDKCET